MPNSISTNKIPNELFQGYSDELLNFAAIACIVFVVIGVPGNILTIVALSRGKQNRNSTAVFIINLSISDLLFGCFNLPLAASTFLRRSWIHGDLLCRLFPLLRYGLLAVSLFTVSLITINRYIIIAHPRQYTRIYQHRYLALMVVGTWLLCFSIMIPTWRGIWGKFGLDTEIGSCSILHDHNDRSPKEFLFVLAFMVPCLCIVFCYARIFYLVRKAAFRSREPASKPISVKGAEANRSDTDQDNVKPNNKVVDAGGGDGYLDLKAFTVTDDIQFIDDNYSLDNLPISYEKISPKAENKSNVSSSFTNDTTKSTQPLNNSNSKSSTTANQNSSTRQNPIKTSIKTSFTRFSPRKNHYVSMGNTSNASAIYPGRMSIKDRRLLKMILVIFVSFVICYLPITLTKIWKGANDNHIFNISGYLLVYLTTCINPIIYVLMSSEYRQAYWNLLRCRCKTSTQKEFKRVPKI
ncbi:G-protein coupled receptor moody [Lucilia sericata]|uniref:G-protein coupled receptor moody n=1 Tax=Lucilia sericata TaxID=13632 RepID=UPI0018A86B8A|nr:G-protein coupled receptor moody [Lucilia sericata]XP_037823276.1 G-protein coupled receptor moody [Lucilia sericata]XP_037823283.1 G-protein coupled receptor moody [Lucilia sericata]